MLRLLGREAPTYVTLEDFQRAMDGAAAYTGFPGAPSEFSVEIQRNSLGFHDVEHASEKPSGAFRIVVLGDSFVEALQVPLDRTFHRRLEGLLRTASGDLRAEVISLGKSGNGSWRELEALHDVGLALSPDLVLVLVFDRNDFHDDSHHDLRITAIARHTHPTLEQRVEIRRKLAFNNRLLWLESSHVNRWLAFGLTELSERRLTRTERSRRWRHRLGVYAAPGSPAQADSRTLWGATLRRAAENYRTMRDLCRARGAAFAVVFVDRPTLYDPAVSREIFSRVPDLEENLDFGRPVAWLKERLGRDRICYFDLQTAFARHFGRTGNAGRYRHDRHWNAEGHALVAAELSAFLEAPRRRGSPACGALTAGP